MKHKDRTLKNENKQFLTDLQQASEEIQALNRKAVSAKPGDIIFTAERDLFKLWSITVLSFVLVLTTALLVSRMSNQQLIIDFGEVWKGRIFQIGFTVVSSIFIFVIWYFLHDKYILKITLLANSAISIKTWKLTGSAERTFEKEAWIVPTTYHEGKTDATPYNPAVNAPYTAIRPYGKKKKYIISEMGDFPFGRNVLDNIFDTSYNL